MESGKKLDPAWNFHAIDRTVNGVFKTWKLCLEQKDVGYSMKFALAFSVAGYLIMGLVNDSMSVTAPIFWVLLGVGSAWNFIDHA